MATNALDEEQQFYMYLALLISTESKNLFHSSYFNLIFDVEMLLTNSLDPLPTVYKTHTLSLQFLDSL